MELFPLVYSNMRLKALFSHEVRLNNLIANICIVRVPSPLSVIVAESRNSLPEVHSLVSIRCWKVPLPLMV